MSGLLSRVAAAPISWGVSEVPGWGHQMEPGRVLAEMQSLGIRASELGPDGFFALDRETAARIEKSGFSIMAGFVPAPLSGDDGLADGDGGQEEFEQACVRLRGTGAGMIVIAIVSAAEGYEIRPRLEGAALERLPGHLAMLAAIATAHDLRPVVHPHYGTYVETLRDAGLVLENSDMGICLDTGHMALAGDDPVKLAVLAADRVQHVHLKDLDARLAARVRDGEIAYHEAVRQGLYPPLGRGDAGVGDVISVLEAAGYDGWYVIEQDVVVEGEPAAGHGPIEGQRESLRFLEGIEETINAAKSDHATSRGDA